MKKEIKLLSLKLDLIRFENNYSTEIKSYQKASASSCYTASYMDRIKTIYNEYEKLIKRIKKLEKELENNEK